ncbi:MAG TPA: hypothetical protein DCG42_07485 [Maribacter sp.]|uniref:DUF6588 family protein n=1 Tax=unclassified Maribacter TaxID=2615042 RepID=UPI000EE55FCD|nr:MULTISPECIES: DUF6588 family protein [unclassified Maribacter]HAF77150.1 hypothetical protein [Maribacter sp.]HAI41647.1 hypothetical protein [Maribacter sp.]|tara:strand:+ start:43584 stop:44600 length:1017 start_codon:yes stop_codon:yes gene_type:complete
MKNLLTCVFLGACLTTAAQADFNNVLAAGVEDAERFTTDYMAPLSESVVYSMSTGWYNTADAKPLSGFEISIIGNITGFKNKEDKKSFILDPSDYENLDFVENPGVAREVSTALGDISGTQVYVEGEVLGVTVRETFELPSGLAGENIDFVPSGYLQASVGVIKGTEIKARFLPKMQYEDASIGLFGLGIQHDFTKLLPADKILPVAISAVIGYTNINGDYDLSNARLIEGENQRIEAEISSWTFGAVVSTKLPIINFYGGVNYITGKSVTDVLGTYRVNSGPFESETYEDPFSIVKKVNGVTGTLGTKLKLGFFRLNAEYNLGEFNTATVGINFGFR